MFFADEARPDPVGRFGWSLVAAAVLRSVPELFYAVHALSERSRGNIFMLISISVAFAYCSTFSITSINDSSTTTIAP